MSKRIQFFITDEQYKQVEEDAAEKGISIAQYFKDSAGLGEEAFEKVWKEFQDKLQKYPRGTTFVISDVIGLERWAEFDRSMKLTLARQLNKCVKAEKKEAPFDNVCLVGRSPYNVSIYRKV